MRFAGCLIAELSPEGYHPSPRATPTWLAVQEHRLSESASAAGGFVERVSASRYDGDCAVNRSARDVWRCRGVKTGDSCWLVGMRDAFSTTVI
jgi:hypothetical protein